MTQNSTRRTLLRTLGTAGALSLGVGSAGCSDTGDGGDGGGDGENGDGDGNGNGDDTSDGSGGTHTVDMTDNLVFDPDEITITTGDTVVWENVGSIGHSVTAYEDDIPDDAEYFASGGFDSEQPARDAYAEGDPGSGDVPGGESYQHTFEVAGSYEYFCIPHEMNGMDGTVEVTE